MTPAARRRASERGQTALLIIGLAIVAIMMVAVVVDASAAFLRRGDLNSVADGAALAAADGIQRSQVYEGGLGAHAAIDPAAAHRLVADYLEATQAQRRYPGLSYVVDATPQRVVVRVVAPLRLPITPPGWDRRASIAGTASTFVEVSH